MKKVSALLFFSVFFITISAFTLFAENFSYGSGANLISLYGRADQGVFFVYGAWFSLDSFTAPLAGTSMSNAADATEETYVKFTPNYFLEFVNRLNIAKRIV